MGKRTLTLLIEFDEDKKPTWIWDNHISKRPWNDIRVISICEGNQLKDPFDENDEEF